MNRGVSDRFSKKRKDVQKRGKSLKCAKNRLKMKAKAEILPHKFFQKRGNITPLNEPRPCMNTTISPTHVVKIQRYLFFYICTKQNIQNWDPTN